MHRYEEGLKSWQIMYSSYEITDYYLDQYGTNEYEDFSSLNPSVGDLPPAFVEPETELGSLQLSEPVPSS